MLARKSKRDVEQISVRDLGKVRNQFTHRCFIKTEVVYPVYDHHVQRIELRIVERNTARCHIPRIGKCYRLSVQLEKAVIARKRYGIGEILRERIDVRLAARHVCRAADACTVRVQLPLHVRIPAEVHVEIPEFERCALDTLREVRRTACRNSRIILRRRSYYDLLPERFQTLDGYRLASRNVRTRRSERHIIGKRLARCPFRRRVFERHAPIQARIIRRIVGRHRCRDCQRFALVARFISQCYIGSFFRRTHHAQRHCPAAFLRRYHDIIVQVIDRRQFFSEPPIGKAFRKHRQHQRGYKQNRKQYRRKPFYCLVFLHLSPPNVLKT